LAGLFASAQKLLCSLSPSVFFKSSFASSCCYTREICIRQLQCLHNIVSRANHQYLLTDIEEAPQTWPIVRYQWRTAGSGFEEAS